MIGTQQPCPFEFVHVRCDDLCDVDNPHGDELYLWFEHGKRNSDHNDGQNDDEFWWPQELFIPAVGWYKFRNPYRRVVVFHCTQETVRLCLMPHRWILDLHSPLSPRNQRYAQLIMVNNLYQAVCISYVRRRALTSYEQLATVRELHPTTATLVLFWMPHCFRCVTFLDQFLQLVSTLSDDDVPIQWFSWNCAEAIYPFPKVHTLPGLWFAYAAQSPYLPFWLPETLSNGLLETWIRIFARQQIRARGYHENALRTSPIDPSHLYLLMRKRHDFERYWAGLDTNEAGRISLLSFAPTWNLIRSLGHRYDGNATLFPNLRVDSWQMSTWNLDRHRYRESNIWPRMGHGLYATLTFQKCVRPFLNAIRLVSERLFRTRSLTYAVNKKDEH